MYCWESVDPVPTSEPHEFHVRVTIQEEPTAEATSALSSKYQDDADVFEKKNAETLPSHRDYGCPIEL